MRHISVILPVLTRTQTSVGIHLARLLCADRDKHWMKHPMKRRKRLFIGIGVTIALLGGVGCSDFLSDDFSTGPIVCTMDMRAGIVITVTDKTTGEEAQTGSTIALQDDNYVETIHAAGTAHGWSGNRVSGAWERKGNYDITITNPNYLTWIRRNVLVTADECHVKTVQLVAKLNLRN